MTSMVVAGPAPTTGDCPAHRRAVDLEDYVVDLTFTFAPMPRGGAALLRAVVVPGREQDRLVACDCLTITTVVAAPSELAAVTEVHDVVRGQLGALAAGIAGTEVTAAALGELLALLDLDPWDEEPTEVDIPLLLDRHLGSRPAWAYDEYLAAARARRPHRG